MLLLTTVGHKSGEERTTPLIYGRSGDDVLLVASNGGSHEPPAWFKNLDADPEVGVQIRGEKWRARARTATPRRSRRCGRRCSPTGSTTTATRS